MGFWFSSAILLSQEMDCSHVLLCSRQPLIPASSFENPSNVAVPNANWFISIFIKKGKRATDLGSLISVLSFVQCLKFSF
ncbi:hypothetical protein RIF29_21891 [Crotalaria pallida]|uniref:Uncharacterized protein n=1 Tax=Crotalaria pallida TaxID=3830 RepID=A0AAN9F8B0_CROPI